MRFINTASSKSRSLTGWACQWYNPEVDTPMTRQHTARGRSSQRRAMKTYLILGGRSPGRNRPRRDASSRSPSPRPEASGATIGEARRRAPDTPRPARLARRAWRPPAGRRRCHLGHPSPKATLRDPEIAGDHADRLGVLVRQLDRLTTELRGRGQTRADSASSMRTPLWMWTGHTDSLLMGLQVPSD
jgi:hypothetical protein